MLAFECDERDLGGHAGMLTSSDKLATSTGPIALPLPDLLQILWASAVEARLIRPHTDGNHINVSFSEDQVTIEAVRRGRVTAGCYPLSEFVTSDGVGGWWGLYGRALWLVVHKANTDLVPINQERLPLP